MMKINTVIINFQNYASLVRVLIFKIPRILGSDKLWIHTSIIIRRQNNKTKSNFLVKDLQDYNIVSVSFYIQYLAREIQIFKHDSKLNLCSTFLFFCFFFEIIFYSEV